MSRPAHSSPAPGREHEIASPQLHYATVVVRRYLTVHQDAPRSPGFRCPRRPALKWTAHAPLVVPSVSPRAASQYWVPMDLPPECSPSSRNRDSLAAALMCLRHACARDCGRVSTKQVVVGLGCIWPATSRVELQELDVHRLATVVPAPLWLEPTTAPDGATDEADPFNGPVRQGRFPR